MKSQRGGFALGLIVGLLIGLALALGVALYIAKVPVPFVDKVGHRTAEQDAAEAEKNKNWDPNAPLAGKPVVPRYAPASSASGAAPGAAPSAIPTDGTGGDPAAALAVPPARLPAPSADAGGAAVNAGRPARDPASILAGQMPATGDPFVYFVQAGAYSRPEDAEQQRAKLALQGLAAKVSEREQGGRTINRVRLGPFDTREEAESNQERLRAVGSEAVLVRVERTRP